jgi:hypothetical protein
MNRVTMIWRGDEAKEAIRRGAARGLRQWAEEDIFEPSQELVPVAPVGGGFLKDTGKVDVDEENLRAAVSYHTPPGEHLAIWVHENLTAQHQTGKTAKFLENPLNASRVSGPEKVAAAIREELG